MPNNRYNVFIQRYGDKSMTSIDRSHLMNEAHRLARIHTMLHQVETYLEGLAKGLTTAWSVAKAKAAAAAKRMQKPTHV